MARWSQLLVALSGLVVIVAIIFMTMENKKHRRKGYREVVQQVAGKIPGRLALVTFQDKRQRYLDVIKSGAYAKADLACRDIFDTQEYYDCLRAVY